MSQHPPGLDPPGLHPPGLDPPGLDPPGPGALAGRHFAAVLFDLDGTLIDSTPAVLRSWDRWSADHGWSEAPAVAHGVPARQMLATLLPAEEVEAAFTRLEAIELSELDGITVLPGALAALTALPSDRMAIVTSGTPPLAMARITATGLPAPSLVITPDDVARGKPDPAPYRLAAERLGFDPSDCLVVEDAPAGLVSGRDAGCRVLALTTSHLASELTTLADAVIGSLAEVSFRFVDGWISLV